MDEQKGEEVLKSSFEDVGHEDNIGLSNWLLLLFVFVNQNNIKILSIYNSMRFQKYIYGARELLGYSSSRMGIKVGKVIKFLDTVGFHLQ